MRRTRTLALLCALLAVSGCRRHYSAPESPMPANTVLLSEMLRQQPGFTDTLLTQLNHSGKAGPALTPGLLNELRKRILGADWRGLDRFPGWTMGQITPTVDVILHAAGAPAPAQYLDVGPYALDKPGTVSLDQPSDFPGFLAQNAVIDLGHGVQRGDGPSPLAAEHADSLRLADVLNRLAANPLDGAKPFAVEGDLAPFVDPPTPSPPGSTHDYYFRSAKTPAELIELLSQTHTVTVSDARYFANFAHLHYKGDDVMAPFWINTRLVIPGSGGRPLLLPVAHAEYEWHIRGPLMNADVSWYYGIDGKAEFRTMDTLDQRWVMKRDVHVYTGADAVEVTRLTGLFTLAYMRLHAAHPRLAFGGYYRLGVCQDSIAAIEQHMTGTSTLFPNTADVSFFRDPRDAEINKLIAAIPKDREGKPPAPERIFGSLPLEPAADLDHAFDAVAIPGLAADLNATYAAWQRGKVRRTHPLMHFITVAAAGLVLAAMTAIFVLRRKRLRSGAN